MRLFSKLSSLISPLVYLFVSPSLAFANHVPGHLGPVTIDPCPPEGNAFRKLCTDLTASDANLFGRVITIAFVLAVLLALAFLIYGGVKWITSGGDKAAVEAARNTIVAAIIGLVIVFLSYFILQIVLGVFNINLNQLTIPSITR